MEMACGLASRLYDEVDLSRRSNLNSSGRWLTLLRLKMVPVSNCPGKERIIVVVILDSLLDLVCVSHCWKIHRKCHVEFHTASKVSKGAKIRN